MDKRLQQRVLTIKHVPFKSRDVSHKLRVCHYQPLNNFKCFAAFECIKNACVTSFSNFLYKKRALHPNFLFTISSLGWQSCRHMWVRIVSSYVGSNRVTCIDIIKEINTNLTRLTNFVKKFNPIYLLIVLPTWVGTHHLFPEILKAISYKFHHTKMKIVKLHTSNYPSGDCMKV